MISLYKWLNSADYLLYMDTHQQICLQVFEAFEKKRIEFAFTTQTLLINNENNLHSKD